ncbi:hypothetical protein HYR99_12940 [Candidatus Poribacteria bacterium]|nr:hypothetical protein [Candidatus Poribacteria bacterium]
MANLIDLIKKAKKSATTGLIIGNDGAPMVLIHAGKFQMGSNDGGDDETPVHTVYLDAFYSAL